MVVNFSWFRFGLGAAALLGVASCLTGGEPSALVLLVGDQHSAYERAAQLVATVDELRAGHAGLPIALLINGDSMEYGNSVARRSGGAVDLAVMAALAQRVPVILNLGNHEAEFYPMAETVRRISATGVTVIGNQRDRATGESFVPASTRLELGAREAVVVGFATDHVSTYPAAIRASLQLEEPAGWARKNLPALLAAAPLRIVLSHSGVQADRAILPLAPDGTLFAGAHDHLAFVQREGRTAYVHSGSWNDRVTLAWLRVEGEAVEWEIEQRPLSADGPADPALATLIRETRAVQLTADDARVVGRTPRGFSPAEAALFVTEAVRVAAGAEVAVIGNTTFGAGLPAGAVARADFDSCIRFDNTIMTGEVEGARLLEILAAANQGPDTPFARRRGEFLVAAVAPGAIEPGRRYRIATTDWVVKNAVNYLGDEAIRFAPLADLKLKAIGAAALAGSPTRREPGIP